MKPRQDLLHLTAEALAQTTNAGIVNRALHELESGYRPQCALQDDGTLFAQFDDAITVTWPEGRAIAQAECTCGAVKVCRHRIIAALAYRHEQTALTSDALAIASPATLGDEQLQVLIAAPILKLAREQARRGLTVEVRSKAAGEPCDTARLPAATVRFWAGAALGAARCDCVRASGCEHLVLGVWAFRAALQRDPQAAALQVRLGAAGVALQLERRPYLELTEALLQHGVALGVAPIVQPLTHAIESADSSGATWLRFLLADIEHWSAAYANRSALYDIQRGVRLLSELALRLAAGTQPGRAKQVLGMGEAQEVELDRLRLMSLGARTARDGERRHTRMVLADTDTATQLMLTRDWAVPESKQDAEVRAAERLAPGVWLDQLAQGQLVAQQARRLADGTMRLAKQRSSQNSVLPQAADWQLLSSPLRCASLAQLTEQQRTHPTLAVLPRHAARRFVVFTPSRIEELCYDPNEQILSVRLLDAEGGSVVAQRRHEGHVRHALDALAAGYRGELGALRHVAGILHWQHGVPVLEPWALACDRIVVPDFAAPTGALAKVELGRASLNDHDAVGTALWQLRELLATLLHHGVRQLPRSWPAAAAMLVDKLRNSSLHALEQRLQELARDVSATSRTGTRHALAAPLLELAALLQLHEDAQAFGAHITS